MVLRRESRNPGAVAALEALSDENPGAFLDVVREIAHLTEDTDVLMHTASLLQVSLETNVNELLPRVEEIAKSDAQFKSLLAWCVPSEPTDELWSRLRRVAGQVPW
jgi:hypothetical protein